MASLVNAFRNIMSDTLWILKLIILSAPVYFILNDEGLSGELLGSNFPVLAGIILLYFGCGAVLMNRNINNNSPVLPSLLTIPEVILRGIGSIIAALPGLAVLYGVCLFINSNVVLEEPFVLFVIYTCVIAFFTPFILVPMVLFCVNGKITDAFRFDKVFSASGNFVVAALSFIIQYFFYIFIIAFILYKLLLEMLGEGNPFLLMFISFVAVVSFFLIFSYSSDLYGDVIPAIKSKRDVL